MARTEPGKEENEAAIAELKRETRGTIAPGLYREARSGIYSRGDIEAFTVIALCDDGQSVRVALFPYDNFDGGKRRDAARIMAEELAERINKA